MSDAEMTLQKERRIMSTWLQRRPTPKNFGRMKLLWSFFRWWFIPITNPNKPFSATVGVRPKPIQPQASLPCLCLEWTVVLRIKSTKKSSRPSSWHIFSCFWDHLSIFIRWSYLWLKLLKKLAPSPSLGAWRTLDGTTTAPIGPPKTDATEIVEAKTHKKLGSSDSKSSKLS